MNRLSSLAFAMRLALLILAISIVTVAGSAAAGIGRSPAPSRAHASALGELSPLSENDKESSHQTGCNFAFSGLHHDFIQLIGDELMMRTALRLHVRPIENADAFMAAKGAGTICDGFELNLQGTGRTRHYPAADSSSTPARLVVRHGGISRTMRGYWNVAC